MSNAITFDYFDLAEIPTFVLCNPNGEELYSLGGISERKYTKRFTTISELTFRADQYIDEVLSPYYDYLTYRRLIHTSASTMGYFMITDVKEEGDGIQKYKEVKCESLEVELMTKKISLFEETQFPFYVLESEGETVISSSSLIGTIINNHIPHWGFEIHDWTSGSLANRQRSFDVSDSSIYTFLTTEAEQSYECIFTFDNENKIIHAYEAQLPREETNIYISYDNLLQHLTVQESTDNLVTCMTVLGGNDLDISYINPLGTNNIYDFSYFKNDDWMSGELQTAITDWENDVINSQSYYEDLVRQLDNANIYLGVKEAAQDQAESNLSVARIVYDAAIEENDPIKMAEASGSITYYEDLIDSLQTEIDTVLAGITYLSDLMENTANLLSFEGSGHFTDDLYIELQPFIIQSTYINENFKVATNASASSIQQEAHLLYNQGVVALTRVSQPRYTFEVESANLMMIKDFETFKNQLDIGKTITLEIAEGITIQPVLLEYTLNFDDPTEFKMMFGNRLHLDDDSFQYGDLINEAIRYSKKTQLKYAKWDSVSPESLIELNEFMNSPIDTSENNIISGANRTIVFDQTGIIAKDPTNPSQQLWLKDSILFTENAWSTQKTAVGTTDLTVSTKSIPSNVRQALTGTATGVIADSIVGHLVADETLVFGNTSGSFLVTKSDVTIVIKATNGHNMIYLNPTYGIRITKDGSDILSLDSSGDLHITHS